ncbi:MAG: VanW family protein [Flavobacteriaceae bacterium]|nr:VanW family protein [Flavobacteriaceae bacterium]
MLIKPIKRSFLRKYLGKKYYSAKRRIYWLTSSTKYSNNKNSIDIGNVLFKHKSLIRRPLRDVEMYLQDNKRVNLSIAIQKINNILIKPGETMSFWKLVGKPTKRKGYLDGLVLDSGKITKGTGGGLCQLGNLLFWIFAHSHLEIVERYRHGFDVFPDVNRKVPFGSGATLSYPHIDLCIKNTTKNTYQLKLWLDKKYLNGSLLCETDTNSTFEVIEENHEIKLQSWGMYTRHNELYKIEKESDNIISKKIIVRNDAIMMYNPILTEKTI